MKKLLNLFCVIMAFICVILGATGIAIPVLPTTPFLLVAVVLFAKGSKRLHKWFLSTKLYKRYLENFLVTKSMTLSAKVKLLFGVTIIFIIGIICSPFFAKIIIGIVAAFHYIYFIFVIKTAEEENKGISELPR